MVSGQHHGLDRICLSLSCILAGTVSLQAVPRLLSIFDSMAPVEQPQAIPAWTTSRMWLMQLGLGQLRLPLVQADDWVWLVDHSVQLGRNRCLVVLGGRWSELPGGPLRRCDLRLLHLRVMRDPNMDSNYEELLQVQRRTGVPRVVVSDHGADREYADSGVLLGDSQGFREGPQSLRFHGFGFGSGSVGR